MTRPRLLLASLALVAAAVALDARAARAAPPEPELHALRRAQADRLAALAATAKDAHLGSMAVRLYEEALGLFPDQSAARAALGWTMQGSAWRPPTNAIPGDGWPDDGEADLARLEKKEASLRQDYVKGLVAAAAAAKAKKAADDVVATLLWAAIAVDPTDPAPRRALGHREVGGRFVAPEHADLLAAGLGPTEGDRVQATAPVVTTSAEPPVRSLAGTPDPVPKGAKAPTAGQVHGLAGEASAEEGARFLERARTWVQVRTGADPSRGPAYAFLHAGSLDVARALLKAEPGGAALVDRLGVRSSVALGRTGLVLVVGESDLALFDALVSTRVENDVAGLAAEAGASRWLSRSMGALACMRLLGTTVGYAASPRRFAGVTGPLRRPDEPLAVFVRRLVATGTDADLEEIAAEDDRATPARDLLVGAFVLDWLLRRDEAKARAFFAAIFAAKGSSVERLGEAAKAAGFPSTRAMNEAWRRFVADVHPYATPAPAGTGAWKVAELDPMKTVGEPRSLYLPVVHPLGGSLTLGGRPYLCEATADGASVRVQAYRQGEPPRVVTKAGEVLFPIAREYGGGMLDVKVELTSEGGRWGARRAEAFRGELDGHPVEVYDLDLDGRFGGFGRDGLVVDHGLFALPLAREFVLGAKVYEIRRVGPDGRQLAWRARPLEAKGPDLEAFLALNDVRVGCGLPGLAFDADLARGVAAHAAYVAANFGASFSAADAAREEPAKKGSTPEGAALASRALVADEPSPKAAIRRWLASPRTLAALLDPDARRAAIAASGGVVVFATKAEASDAPSEFTGPLVCPTADVVAEPAPAGVDLVRGDRAFAGCGAPIVVRFAPGRGEVLDLRLTPAADPSTTLPLRVLDRAKTGVAGLFACLPEKPLAPSSAYAVTLTYVLDGARVGRTWTFRTGPR